MRQDRWLRIIPVALIMYTISYVDRTNVALALDPEISTMMKDLFMDDRMKGQAAGIFFFGYVLLQIPGGYWASRWSARKIVSIFLVGWGVCAVGCGMSRTFHQFEVMRFLLGVAESGVFPATLVLLADWFPRSERARANALWNLCQPLAVAGTAPLTGWLIGDYGWQRMIVLEGLLPFVWLPIWWVFIRDRPSEAPWISAEERTHLEVILSREAAEQESSGTAASDLGGVWYASVPIMVVIYFLHNCEAYGCMTFFTAELKGRGFSAFQHGLFFALPYVITAVVMVLNSWHSDRMHERRGHVAAVYALSGVSLILSVLLRGHFWVSYGFLCLAIPGPFAAMGPFWAIPSEMMPRKAVGPIIGLVNAFGNLGGFVGPSFVGWMAKKYDSTAISFNVLGAGMLICAVLAFLLPAPRARRR